jgi:hypothetical protein
LTINQLLLSFLLITLLSGGSATEIDQVLSQYRFDLGKMPEGQIVDRTITLTNLLDKKLTILSLHTSCGCTLLEMKQKEIPPKGSSPINLSMDTSAKKGDFLKVIDLENSIFSKPIRVIITGHVTHDPGKMKNPQVIFKGRCKKCHAPKGVEKLSGKDLYQTVCYMCHQNGTKLKKSSSRQQSKVISLGVKSSSMAAFAKKQGGILTKEQIESLVDYLQLLRAGNR